MRKISIVFILFFALASCTDNKKIIEQSKAMHADSASLDSINFSKLKIQDEKINGIIIDSKFYSTTQLDSIFSGKK